MLKTKIAVFVSGGGTNLQALINAEKRGEILSGEIALVLASNDSAYALTRAAENGIKSVVIKRKEFSSQEAYEEEMKKVLDDEEFNMVDNTNSENVSSEKIEEIKEVSDALADNTEDDNIVIKFKIEDILKNLFK